MEGAQLRVREDLNLGAVSIELVEEHIELVLGPPAACALIMRMVNALIKIEREEASS